MFITTIIVFLFGNINLPEKDISSDGFYINFESKTKNNIAFIALSLQAVLMIYNFQIGNFATE